MNISLLKGKLTAVIITSSITNDRYMLLTSVVMNPNVKLLMLS